MVGVGGCQAVLIQLVGAVSRVVLEVLKVNLEKDCQFVHITIMSYVIVLCHSPMS